MSGGRQDRQIQFLHDLLGSVRVALRRRAAVGAALWATAAVLAATAVLLVADAAFRFAGAPRLAAYGVILVGGAAVAGVAVFAAWKRTPSRLYVARVVEQCRPDLKNALITFLDLEADPAVDRSTCVAVGRRAVRVLAKADPASLLPPPRLRRPVGAAAAAGVLVLALLWLVQGILVRPWVAGASGFTGASRPSAATPGPGTASKAAGAEQIEPQEGETGDAEEAVPGQCDPAAEVDAKGAADSEANGGEGEPSAPDPAAGQAPGAQAAAEQGAAEEVGAEVQADAEAFERLAAALADEPSGRDAEEGPGNDPGETSGAGDASPSPGSPSGDGAEPAEGTGADEAGRPTGEPGEGAEGAPGESEASEAEATTPPRGADTAEGPGAPQVADPSAETAEAGAGPQPEEAAPSAGEAAPTPGEGGGPGTGGDGPPRLASDGPPIPERPQPAHVPDDALEATRWASDLVHEAAEKLSEGEVSDAFLDRMGMSQAEFRRFLVAWQRKMEASGAGLGATAPPSRRRVLEGPADEPLRQATGSAAAAAVLDAGSAARDPDAEAVRAERVKVSPRLAPAVSAYFETLGRLGRRAEPPGKHGP